MNTLIITGGQIDIDFAANYLKNHTFDHIIAADAGLVFCREADIIPDLILGDFDSADSESVQYFVDRYPERVRRFQAEKDETDTELAIMEAIRSDADEITVLGATGTRMDHVLGNIQLLKMALDAGVKCFLVDAYNRIQMVKNRCILKKEDQFGKYISLIPFTPLVTGLTLKGFKYSVSDFVLEMGKARGVSNEIQEDVAEIEFQDGLLLVIESRD